MVGAYSIGTAPKCVDSKAKQNVPGVGSYSPEKMTQCQRKSPSFSLPRANKLTIKKTMGPSPSTYQDQSPNIKRRMPSYVIGLKNETELERKLRKEVRPGPANYNPFRTSLTNIGYTMQARNDPEEILFKNLTSEMRESVQSLKVSPGPADYKMRSSFDHSETASQTGFTQGGELAKNLTQSSCMSIGKQNTYRLNDGSQDPLIKDKYKVPGPGNYHANIDDLVTKRGSQRTIIGTSRREGSSFYDTQAVKNPGPQDYNTLKTFIGKGMKTMAILREDHCARTRGSKMNNNPGVGAYNVSKSQNYTKMKIPSCRIGTSVRESLDSSSSVNITLPGPGEYEVDKTTIKVKNRSPKAFIGTSRRDYLNKTINWPGPGSYNNLKDIGTDKPIYQKLSMFGRNRDGRNGFNNSPGPIYNTIEASTYSSKQNPSFKIGTGPKMQLNLKSSRINPGPGFYHMPNKPFSSTGSFMRQSFPKALRQDLARLNGTPGPGSYKLPAKFAEVQNYQIPKDKRITEV